MVKPRIIGSLNRLLSTLQEACFKRVTYLQVEKMK